MGILTAILYLAGLTSTQQTVDASFFELRVEVASDRSPEEQYLAPGGSRPRFEDEPIINLSHVDHAYVHHEQLPAEAAQPDSNFSVTLKLTPEGRTVLAEKTRDLVGRRVGVFVGGKLKILATLRTEIRDLVPASEPELSEVQAESLAREINERIARLRESSQ
jgi:hypothetical protein